MITPTTKYTKPSRRGAAEYSAAQRLFAHNALHVSRFAQTMRRNNGRIAKLTILATICLMLTFLVPTLTVVRRRLVAQVGTRMFRPFAGLIPVSKEVSASEDPLLADKYTEFRVIVDAGSSGTRAYIYGFKGENDLTPHQEKTEAFKGGLDTHVAGCELNPGDWESGRKKLVKICKTIFKNIDQKLCEIAGEGKHFNTPVTVKFLATEGMRTYNRGNGAGDDALMRTIRSQFKLLCEKYRYKFLAAEILHGELEAMGAWVDANCLYPNDDGTPVGIMEVGGASMQIMTRPSRNGMYCNASFGKDAAMRIIVKKLNEEIANCSEENYQETPYTHQSELLFKKGRQTPEVRSTRSSRLKQKHTLAKFPHLQTPKHESKVSKRRPKRESKVSKRRPQPESKLDEYNLGKALREMVDGSNYSGEDVTKHPIFQEGNETELQKLIRKYLFTPDNIEAFKLVTKKREKIVRDIQGPKLTSQLSTRNLSLRGLPTVPQFDEDSEDGKKPTPRLKKNLSTDPKRIESKEIDEVNKKIIARDGKRNYLLACSFEHLEDALEGNAKAKRDDPNYNFFKYISERKIPKFTELARTEHKAFVPSNRFMFFFAKQLYEELKDNIDVSDTKTPPSSIMWTRGLAIMQTFDKSNDTEMNPDELKKLIKSMRATKGFCKGFFSMI